MKDCKEYVGSKAGGKEVLFIVKGIWFRKGVAHDMIQGEEGTMISCAFGQTWPDKRMLMWPGRSSVPWSTHTFNGK